MIFYASAYFRSVGTTESASLFFINPSKNILAHLRMFSIYLYTPYSFVKSIMACTVSGFPSSMAVSCALFPGGACNLVRLANGYSGLDICCTNGNGQAVSDDHPCSWSGAIRNTLCFPASTHTETEFSAGRARETGSFPKARVARDVRRG